MLTGEYLVQELDEERCWRAILQRSDTLAGTFLFGVVTTGIFCRPSCPSRRAKRENLRLFRTPDEAIKAGFRPCKRCKPDAQSIGGEKAELIAGICRRIEAAEEMPTLAGLAEEAGISAFHLHRKFKSVTGVTPKAYMAGVKASRLREGLGQARSVTDAIYEAGYASSSRFYEKSNEILGMEPRQYQSGGKGVWMQYAVADSWLGRVLVAATERGICAILFGDDDAQLARDLHERFHAANIEQGTAGFASSLVEVLAAIETPSLAVNLPLDIIGTAFQQRIWAALRAIPMGETASYAEIAGHVGSPKASRAVAAACAANPLAVAIPCHRVIRGNGELSGYRWGVERKRRLLEREAEKAGKPRPSSNI